jgi:hypothetical protein
MEKEEFLKQMRGRIGNLPHYNRFNLATALYLIGEVNSENSLHNSNAKKAIRKLGEVAEPEVGYLAVLDGGKESFRVATITDENPLSVTYRNDKNLIEKMSLKKFLNLGEKVKVQYKIPSALQSKID